MATRATVDARLGVDFARMIGVLPRLLPGLRAAIETVAISSGALAILRGI